MIQADFNRTHWNLHCILTTCLNVWSFQISATDDGDPPLTNSSILTIVLMDVDDIKPQFTHKDYHTVLHPGGYQVKILFFSYCTDRERNLINFSSILQHGDIVHCRLQNLGLLYKQTCGDKIEQKLCLEMCFDTGIHHS